MDKENAPPKHFALRFTLAGRIAILASIPLGIAVAFFVSEKLLSAGMNFPILLPAGAGIGAALLWIGFSRFILPRLGLQFWSEDESARREAKSNSEDHSEYYED